MLRGKGGSPVWRVVVRYAYLSRSYQSWCAQLSWESYVVERRAQTTCGEGAVRLVTVEGTATVEGTIWTVRRGGGRENWDTAVSDEWD